MMTASADPMAAYSTSCEYNITCSYPDYGTATQKRSEDELQVVTYSKDTTYRQVSCLMGKSACSEDEHFWKLGARCKCWKTSNHFLIGVEQMNLNMRHEFDQLRGISASDKRSSTSMVTRIRKGSIQGEVLATFAPGEDIRTSVQEWMAWAGVENLDMVNEQALADYPPASEIPEANNKPIFRMTGVEIILEANYMGSVGFTLPFGLSKPIECDLVISHRGGYHSFGSHPTFMGSGADVIDRYLRGINFKISSRGTIGEFSVSEMLVNFVIVFVYFGQVPMLIHGCLVMLSALLNFMEPCLRKHAPEKVHNASGFLAYEAATWDGAINESWSLDRHHAKRLLHTVLVRMVFEGNKDIHSPARLSYLHFIVSSVSGLSFCVFFVIPVV